MFAVVYQHAKCGGAQTSHASEGIKMLSFLFVGWSVCLSVCLSVVGLSFLAVTRISEKKRCRRVIVNLSAGLGLGTSNSLEFDFSLRLCTNPKMFLLL